MYNPPVKYVDVTGDQRRGILVGFFHDDQGELVAAISGVSGFGIMLTQVHPSKLIFLDPFHHTEDN